jgi:hypothetical protein
MRIPYSLLLLPALQLALAQVHTAIDFQHFGNYADLRTCAKQCLAEYCCQGNLAGMLGCGTNECLCGHQSEGQDLLRTCVNSACTSNTADLGSATALYAAYCASYQGSATPTTAGTKTISPAGVLTPTGKLSFLFENI